MQVPQLVAGQKKWLMISAGRQNTCGITLDNDAYCWGRDNEGQFGDGAGDSSHTIPKDIVTGGHKFRYISTAYHSVCAISIDNKAYCWGRNDNGEVGNGNQTDQFSPVYIMDDVAQIETGTNSSCAQTFDGKNYCWGQANWGKLGNGQTSGTYTTPQLVLGGKDWTTADTLSPDVSIKSAQSSPTNSATLNISVEFSETVSNFTLADISLVGGVASNFSNSVVERQKVLNTVLM